MVGQESYICSGGTEEGLCGSVGGGPGNGDVVDIVTRTRLDRNRPDGFHHAPAFIPSSTQRVVRPDVTKAPGGHDDLDCGKPDFLRRGPATRLYPPLHQEED